MIRAGRDVVDRAAIAQLHGLSESQANRRRPWAAEGHPTPVYAHKQHLWDTEQATAYANGEPIPALPEVDSSDDLLDRFEAAAVAGVAPNSWETGRSRGTFPTPDDVKHGVPFWLRSTVADFVRFRAERAERGGYNPSGRPKGTTGSRPAKSQDLEQRIRAVLAELERAGQPVVKADIARRLNINVSTLRYHLAEIEKRASATDAPAHS
ncbi:hypothetical protein [Lentzea terrae]|uniref:hypothetical protein n=1 Tax=Lentzea terrae TaxID=2200761 RepID=UPI000DD46D76|nr:hypothetical protein [Lentzea terrae]